MFVALRFNRCVDLQKATINKTFLIFTHEFKVRGCFFLGGEVLKRLVRASRVSYNSTTKNSLLALNGRYLPLIAVIILLLEESLIEINKVESFGCTSHCGVEPAQHIFGHRLVAKDAPIHKYRLPLSALRLVAGYGVGEFYLQSIEIVVLANLLQAFQLALDIEVILLNFTEKSFALLASERWRLGVQSVQQYLTLNLGIVIVAKR